MCWMLLQKPGAGAFPKKKFHNAWETNDDGAGFMFCADGKLIVEKGFYKLKHFLKAYYAAYQVFGQSSPFCVHFRWATHGTAVIENLHPHVLVADEPMKDGGQVCHAAMAHNGILHFDTLYTQDGRSDTAYFCETVLAHRTPEFLVSEFCREWLAEMIGPSNKFVIMDGLGNFSIINEKQGYWVENNWFSNAGHVCSSGQKYAGLATNAANNYGWVDTGGALVYKPRGEVMPVNPNAHVRRTDSEVARGAIEGEVVDSESNESLFLPPGEDSTSWDTLGDMEWQERHLEQRFDEAMYAGDEAECRAIVEEMRTLYGDKGLPKYYQSV